MASKKDNSGFFARLASAFSDGVNKISASFNKGYNDILSHMNLLLKYTLFTLLVAFFYAGISFLFPDFSVFSYTIFLPIAALIIFFYYEFFNFQIKDLYRIIYGTTVFAFLLFAVYMLFSFSARGHPTNSELDVVSIMSSTLAMFIFLIVLFLPLYFVKAGATPFNAFKKAFSFIAKHAIKGMFYVLVLLFVLSSVVTILSFIGLVFLSPVVFVFLSYSLLIFTSAFWECCRND